MIDETLNTINVVSDLHNGNKNSGELFWAFLFVIGTVIVLISVIAGCCS